MLNPTIPVLLQKRDSTQYMLHKSKGYVSSTNDVVASCKLQGKDPPRAHPKAKAPPPMHHHQKQEFKGKYVLQMKSRNVGESFSADDPTTIKVTKHSINETNEAAIQRIVLQHLVVSPWLWSLMFILL